jgi:glucose/arabinose dehydrogenase
MSNESTGGRESGDRPLAGSGGADRTRRRFLALTAAGVAGTGGVAGCSTTTSTPTDGGGSDGSGDGSDSDGVGSDGSDSDGAGDGSDGGDATPTVTPGSVARPLEAWPGYDPDWEAPTTSPLEADLETEVLVENLEIPWDLAFAPDGTLFITERVGRILQFDGGEVRTVAEPAGAIDAGSLEPGSDERPWWVDGGEGGTLGIAVHPDYPDPAHVFVYYTYTDEEGEKYNRVDVFDVERSDPATPVRTVVDEIPANNFHNGGRVTFGPRNHLWITCGDGGERGKVRDLTSHAGKILRVTPEGDPAPGNPEYDDPDADRRIFSYGHRNPQGLVWTPDGTPFNSEHGPTGFDEINRLVAGGDYGWDTEALAVREPEEYSESDVHPPLFTTGSTSFAPTGSLFYTGETVPALRNRMITGGLISQQLVVTTLTPDGEELPPSEDAYDQVTGDWSDQNYTATVHTMFENELGRVRHVEQGPEGDVYVCTSNRDGRAKEGFPRDVDDVLVRLRPA